MEEQNLEKQEEYPMGLDNDHDKQTQFRRILDKHLFVNKVYLTSNELHTLFDACIEFINLYQKTLKD